MKIFAFIFLLNWAFAEDLKIKNPIVVSNSEFQSEVNHIFNKFNVKAISVDTLDSYIKNNKKIILLDVRSNEEYRVSHLKNSINLNVDEFNYEKFIKNLHKESLVVVYCAAGFRSSVVSEKLQKEGVLSYSLFGGIIEWSNRNYHLFDNNEKVTKRIHAVNEKWSKWIKTSEKVY